MVSAAEDLSDISTIGGSPLDSPDVLPLIMDADSSTAEYACISPLEDLDWVSELKYVLGELDLGLDGRDFGLESSDFGLEVFPLLVSSVRE